MVTGTEGTPLVLVLSDDFAGPELDRTRWLDHYLPHWTTPERSVARYTLGPDGLRLLIESDQPAWRPEDGGLRVSNLQTGSCSGPLGSDHGQHRHRADLAVRTPQPLRRLWTPSAGRVEVTARASADLSCMLAAWLVGFEETPEDSGEICLFELSGSAMGAEASVVRCGVKAHHDPRLREEMTDLTLSLDGTAEHTYAVEWDARQVRFFVDDAWVSSVEQGFAYPLQLMVDLFELPESDEREPADYPKAACVRRVRGYEPAQASAPGTDDFGAATRSDPTSTTAETTTTTRR